ncbi:sensor histidine kinase [Aquincola tertiaricarbonis]|uniref:histidine kinase n=1 Tax=Aquincola tertiaricarbonis TaxID=391953 RepID=A0ABY4SIV9_AQUTE|nr:sensor histidine kinase [Aquincola tertiaricarbonis]
MARRVMLPLGVVWLVGSLAAAAVGSYFAATVFDRALLDDALGLAAAVQQARGGDLQVTLTVDELRAVLFDQSESVVFALRRPDGTLVAGDARLQLPRRQPAAAFEFADLPLDEEPMRAVVLDRTQPQPFTLVVAQTMRYRGALLRRLLLYSTAPQVLLLVCLGVWLRRSIRLDLQPIAELQSALNRRNATDLQPLPVRAGTADVQSLVQSIDALMARLSDALRSQREFAGNVAHELRTPLAGIRALADYGLASSDPQQWREQLQGIALSQARASRLVDQLLAIALADEATGSLVLQPVALDELARRVLLRAMPQADAAGVDLGAQGLDEPAWVLGDEALIEGALQNLLDNALRYGRPPDGSPPQVTVGLQAQGGEVQLWVQDNGPGLAAASPQAAAAADTTRLLARWQQGGPGRALGEGAGLGLAIVSRYAALLQARLLTGPAQPGPGARLALVFRASAPPAV